MGGEAVSEFESRRRSLKRGASSAASATHRLKQIAVFTNWINSKVCPRLEPVTDLVGDLKSGCVLSDPGAPRALGAPRPPTNRYVLVEALAREPLAPIVGKCDFRGGNRAHHMANLSLVRDRRAVLPRRVRRPGTRGPASRSSARASISV